MFKKTRPVLTNVKQTNLVRVPYEDASSDEKNN